MHPMARSFAGMLLLASFCAGCADNINVSSTILTNGTSLQAGKRVPVTHFTTQDYAVQLTDFDWPDAARDGGLHNVRFNWYKDDHLVSSTHRDYLRFTSTPYTLYTKRAVATLGAGHFRVDTVVDGRTVASNVFDVSA